MNKIKGEFEIKGQGIFGWVVNEDNLGESLWIEALCDGEPMGIALADTYHPEGFAFCMALPSIAFESGGKIEARVANTNCFLPQKITYASASSPKFEGDYFYDFGQTFSGWVVDPQNPDMPVHIKVKHEGEIIADMLANQRARINGAEHGHGYSFQIPLELMDGKERDIYIQDKDGRELPGSPCHVCTLPISLANWLTTKNKLSPADIKMLADCLRKLEKIMPRVITLNEFQMHKKLFPLPPLAGKNKLNIKIVLDNGDEKMAKALAAKLGLQPAKASADVLLMQQTDKLQPRAVDYLAAALAETGADIVYADSEDSNGMPLFKPAWDKEAFLAGDYLGPMLVSGKLYASLNPWPGEDYWALRSKLALSVDKKNGIKHLPLPLSVESDNKNSDARHAFINSWLAEEYPGSKAELQANGNLRARYHLARKPLVSLIIPTRDHADLLDRCLESIYKTNWPELEIIIIDNGSTEESALKLFAEVAKKTGVYVLPEPGPFNYAALNNKAVAKANGELLCFLNNDTEVIDNDWLYEMASLLLADERNGCVGAKLLWPDGLVQHGGVVIGIAQLATHVGNTWIDEEPGYMGRNLFAQQYSAVTGACLLTPKKLFQELGGFDSRRFAINFNDTDYCLRLRKINKRVLWTPHARLIHHESVSRGKKTPLADARFKREMGIFRSLWGGYIDPFYNPSLHHSFASDVFNGLAVPPLSRRCR